MYYKDVEEHYPSYEFTTRAELMTWLQSPAGIAIISVVLIIIVSLIYYFFIKKEESSSTFSYY